jgi:hypothetical protein
MITVFHSFSVLTLASSRLNNQQNVNAGQKNTSRNSDSGKGWRHSMASFHVSFE